MNFITWIKNVCTICFLADTAGGLGVQLFTQWWSLTFPGVDGSPQSGHVHTLCYLLIKNNSVPLGFLEFQMLCIYNVLTIFLTLDIKPLMKVNWPATSYFILISDFCIEYQQSCTKSTVLLFSQVWKCCLVILTHLCDWEELPHLVLEPSISDWHMAHCHVRI